MNEKQLWAHQRTAVNHAISGKHFALLFDMGTGKSATAVTITRHWYHAQGGILRTLILAPITTLEQWRDEWRMWSEVDKENISTLKGLGARKYAQFINFADLDGALNKPVIVITNYESLLNNNLFAALMAWRPQVLIADESHRCKNYKSARTKLVTKLADKANYKLILTGSPILNSLLDIYSQYRILDGGETFGKSYFEFLNRYFYNKNAMKRWHPSAQIYPDWQPREGADTVISQKMYHRNGKPIAMRVLKKDCLDLPPLIEKVVTFEMNAEQAKMYKEMRKEYLTWAEEVANPEASKIAVVANMGATKVLRLQQIVSGFVRGEDMRDYPIVGNPRRETLKDLLEDIPGKVVIWAAWKRNYQDIREVCQELKLKWTELTGETKDKEAAIQCFRKDPDCRILIAHPQSGGVGVNLTEAATCIFYSRSFSLEHEVQAMARNYRGGSEMHEKITRIDIVCKNSIDEVVVAALKEKKQLSTSVVDIRNMLLQDGQGDV